MSYEIPQQLEYKERIIFGMTFGQLIYFFLFGFIDLMLLKQGAKYVNQLTIWILVGFVSLLAVGFIFLDFAKHLGIFLSYLKFRGLILSKRKIFRFMGIKKITKTEIINEQNKKLAVLKIIPINLGIKPDEEQEVVLLGFKKFLNSLDFPVQIVMNTEEINLDSYIEKYKTKVKNKLYEELSQDYKTFLGDVIKDNSINNRNFYIIIPETSNLEVQVKICQNKLNSLNLRTKELSIEEITSLLKNYFNNHFNYKTKENSIFQRINPKTIVNQKDFIKVGDTFCRVVSASGYPRIVEGGFLDRIISSPGNFDLSIHIEPFPIETMLINLNKELQKQRADLYSAKINHRINPSLEIKYTDTKHILTELQKGKDKLFNVSLYICCKAKTIKELNYLIRKVKSELNSILIIPDVYNYRQAQSFRSCLPMAINNLKIQRNITSTALSAFFPFTSPFLQVDETGVFLGLNKNKIPIIRDIFKLSNPNGIVLSQSGGGKSYFSKLLIARYLLSGVKVLVIDPQGEYSGLVELFGGQRIELSKDSESIINPLDMMNHDYTSKRLSLMDLMKLMLGELSEPQKAMLDKAIGNTYTDFGFDHSEKGEDTPILSDLKIRLERLRKNVSNIEKNTINSLINRIDMYVSGVFDFLNKQTKIDFNNQLVCFDISQLPKQVKPVLMYLVLDFVYSKMKEDLSRKILLIDEAWTLLGRTEEASYVFEIVKTCRKFNMGLLLINQEVEGLLDSQAGKSVLANSAYTVLLRQKPSVIKQITGTFNLSNSEKELLLTSPIGEGILIMDDEHSEISIVASPKEKKVITTNADEILKQIEQNKLKNKKQISKQNFEQKIILKPKGEIDSSESRHCLRCENVNALQKEHLLGKGYKLFSYYNFFKSKKEKFLVKERPKEKYIHIINTFLIKEFLENKNIKGVYTPASTSADIEFKIKNQLLGIEVETGTQFLKNKNALKEKIEYNNRRYENWAFFVTDRNLYQNYKQYGKIMTKKNIKNILTKLIKNGTAEF